MSWLLLYDVNLMRCTRRGLAPAKESETGSRKLPSPLRSAFFHWFFTSTAMLQNGSAECCVEDGPNNVIVLKIKFITSECDERERGSIYRIVYLFIGSKTGVLKIANFIYSLQGKKP